MEKLNILTKNVKGFKTEKDEKINSIELINKIIRENSDADIISLTEIKKSDIAKLSFDSYRVIEPICEHCNQHSSQMSTCILIKHNIEYIQKKQAIVNEVFPTEKNLFCTARECRIYIPELQLEVVSLYVPVGIGELKLKSFTTLDKLIKEMKSNLESDDVRYIYLGDFNLNPEILKKNSITSHSLKHYFGEQMNTFVSLQEKFEAWTVAPNEDKGYNTTHFDKDKAVAKLDYIFSNLTIEYAKNSKYDMTLGDHTTLYATYHLN